MDDPLRIYLVEDDRSLLPDLCRLFLHGLPGFALGGHDFNTPHTPHLLRQVRADILLANVRLLEQDDWAFLRRAKRACPYLGCLLMTDTLTPDLSAHALDAGAHGLLLKPFRAEELLQSLRAVSAGQCVFSAAAARTLLPPPAPALPEPDTLAPQEACLLQLLCDNKLLKEAADIMGISLETARTYRKRAYTKLGAHKLGEARDKFLGGGGGQAPPIIRVRPDTP